MTGDFILIPSLGLDLTLLNPPYVLVVHIDGMGYPFEHECSRMERAKMKLAEQRLEKLLGSGIRRVLIIRKGYKLLTGLYVPILRHAAIPFDLAKVICVGIEVDPKVLKTQRRLLLAAERTRRYAGMDMPKRLVKEAKTVLRNKLR